MKLRPARSLILGCGMLAASLAVVVHAEEPASLPPPKLDVKYDSGEGVTAKAKVQVTPYGTKTEEKPTTWQEKFSQAVRKVGDKVADALGIEIKDDSLAVHEGPGKVEVNKDGVDASVGVGGSAPGGKLSVRTGLKVGADHGPASELYGPQGENKGFTLKKYVKADEEVLTPDGKSELHAYTEKEIGRAQIGYADPNHRKAMKEAFSQGDEDFRPVQPKTGSNAEPAPAPYHSKPLVLQDAAILIARPSGVYSDSEWTQEVRGLQQKFAQMGKPLEINLTMTELLIRDQGYEKEEIIMMERHFSRFRPLAEKGKRKWQATVELASTPTTAAGKTQATTNSHPRKDAISESETEFVGKLNSLEQKYIQYNRETFTVPRLQEADSDVQEIRSVIASFLFYSTETKQRGEQVVLQIQKYHARCEHAIRLEFLPRNLADAKRMLQQCTREVDAVVYRKTVQKYEELLRQEMAKNVD